MLDSLVRVSRRVLRVPKAVASPTGIAVPGARARTREGPRGAGDAFAGLSKVNRTSQQRARTGDGARSVNNPCTVARACDGLDAHSGTCGHDGHEHTPPPPTPERESEGERRAPRVRAESCGLIPCVYRRAAGRATGGLTRAVLPAARQSPHPSRRPTPSGSRRSTRGEVHDDERRTSTRGSVRAPRGREGPGAASPTDVRPASLTMNLPVRSFGFLRFTPERFHVLLNSLFKVLFNFPSRYLFAIGLVVVFSLRWSLPPT